MQGERSGQSNQSALQALAHVLSDSLNQLSAEQVQLLLQQAAAAGPRTPPASQVSGGAEAAAARPSLQLERHTSAASPSQHGSGSSMPTSGAGGGQEQLRVQDSLRSAFAKSDASGSSLVQQHQQQWAVNPPARSTRSSMDAGYRIPPPRASPFAPSAAAGTAPGSGDSLPGAVLQAAFGSTAGRTPPVRSRSLTLDDQDLANEPTPISDQ